MKLFEESGNTISSSNLEKSGIKLNRDSGKYQVEMWCAWRIMVCLKKNYASIGQVRPGPTDGRVRYMDLEVNATLITLQTTDWNVVENKVDWKIIDYEVIKFRELSNKSCWWSIVS